MKKVLFARLRRALFLLWFSSPSYTMKRGRNPIEEEKTMKLQSDKELLKHFKIFSGYPDTELSSIYSSIYRRHYAKGQILFMEGDPRNRIYFLLSGYVKFERTNSKATLIYTDFVKPFSLFPYGGMLTDRYYHYSAIVTDNVSLFYLPTSAFESFVTGHKRAMLEIIHQLSRLLELHEKRLQTMTVSSASERVIQALRYLINDLGKRVGREEAIILPFRLSTVELAVLSGTTRETVSHVINQLKRDHILTDRNQTITVYNPHFFERKKTESIAVDS
jgi:CRP-like cAMP-binding protein